MAIKHAESGEVIDIRPLGASLNDHTTRALAKTDHLELIRMVLPAGKEIREHKAPREITVQCIEGAIEFNCHGATQRLEGGQMLFLNPREPHSVKAVEDSAVLVTMVL